MLDIIQMALGVIINESFSAQIKITFNTKIFHYKLHHSQLVEEKDKLKKFVKTISLKFLFSETFPANTSQ